MNYLLSGALIGWLIGGNMPSNIYNIGDYKKYLHPLDAQAFADRIDYLLGLYDPGINYVQFNLLDSHDTPRFLTTAGGDLSALKLGWLFLFTYVGAPCIYYGDEIGLEGGPDPACRNSFPWDKKNWNMELHRFVRSLTALRRSQPALRTGTFHRLHTVDNVFVFGRRLGNDRLVIALNASNGTRNVEFPVSALGLPDSPLATLFGEAKARVTGGMLHGLKLAPRSGVVLKA
jgi:neopullulanase